MNNYAVNMQVQVTNAFEIESTTNMKINFLKCISKFYFEATKLLRFRILIFPAVILHEHSSTCSLHCGSLKW